ncbi:hypothetical protein F8568_002335 [Actinomadura sp. LD22]|uniref:Uncharacterized protein n=1 Tax=Actinomadura physcomitrii TaxID=2650748 RepID=A0A6I4M4K9_9ACTN|nr:hypothetical protein [Actinomadura physcomitrii]MVZ99243.1 hypothetical protein [Actinomadura physcomitrii]
MKVILVLLCLAIAGRELYLAFDRRRRAGAPEIADIRTQLTALKGTRDELERFRSAQRERLERLTAQIGPLLIVRTPRELLCGVLPLAELRLPETAGLLDDPSRAAARLRRLPAARLLDAS